MPNLSSIIADETLYVPKSAWKNPEFQDNYRPELEYHFEAGIDESADTVELHTIQKMMLISSLAAFATTYQGKSAPLCKKVVDSSVIAMQENPGNPL